MRSTSRVSRAFVCLWIIPALSLTSCDKSRSDFELTRKLHTEDAYERFIAKHPSSDFIPAATEELRNLRWKAAKASADLKKIEKYLSTYPNSPNDSEARLLLEPLRWEEAYETGAVTALWEYIVREPTSDRAQLAATRIKEVAQESSKKRIIDCSMVFNAGSHSTTNEPAGAATEQRSQLAKGKILGRSPSGLAIELVIASSQSQAGPTVKALQFKGKASYFMEADYSHLALHVAKMLFPGSDPPQNTSFCVQFVDAKVNVTYSGTSITQLSGLSTTISEKEVGAYVGTVNLQGGNGTIRLRRIGDSFPSYLAGVAKYLAFGDRPLVIPEDVVFEITSVAPVKSSK